MRRTTVKLRILSAEELSARTVETVTRFPVLTFSLCVGAAALLYRDITWSKSPDYIFRNIAMCLALLAPILYALRLLHESGWIGKRLALILEVCAIAGCALYLWQLPDGTLIALHSSRFVVLLAGSLLFPLVSIRPGVSDDYYYWRFHASIALRLIITAIYTLVIIGGTSAAFGAIDALFSTRLFHQETRLVIVTLCLFAPMFFVSGVPTFSGTKGAMSAVPGWLKNIGVYVLIPLTTVYLGILYAYTVKILLRWQLPEGSVSYLTLSFAAFGIISLLVIFPFLAHGTPKWCHWFSRYFYILLLPLLFLLFDAIFTRVFTYGVTFSRYYVLALAVWLLFLTIFMIVRGNRNLMVIPFSLLLVAVLSLFGPWSSLNVSYASQKGRLMKLLNSSGLMKDDKLVEAHSLLPLRTRAEISSIATYLENYGRLQAISYLASAKSLTPESFTQAMGFKYIKSVYNGRSWSSCNCSNDVPLTIPVDHYQFLVRFPGYMDTEKKTIKRVQAGGMAVEFLPESAVFQFTDDEFRKALIRLEDLATRCREKGAKDTTNCSAYIYDDDHFEIRCMFGGLSVSEDQKGTHFYLSDVIFLIRKK